MSLTNQNALAHAILETLRSPNEHDRNGEAANVVDMLADVARGAWAIAEAIDRLADAVRPRANGRNITPEDQ
jgi:hypothetical protein